MYYFIVNEYGGSGSVRRNWHGIYSYLKEKEIRFKSYKTESPGHAKRLAEKICAINEAEDTDKRIVVVGGDGTINEVINGITDFDKVMLGVIPLGSANDFAVGIGLSRDPMVALNNILEACGYTNVDLGKITLSNENSRLFGISTGIGLDAYVCKKANESNLKNILNRIHMGDASYVIHTVGALFTMKQIGVQVEVDDKKMEFDRLIYLAAMNMPIEGGGVKMAPGATATDGKLTMVCGHSVNRIQAPPALIKLMSAKHENLDAFTIIDFSKLTIKAESPMVYHTDGEVGEEIEWLSVECLPGRLKFLM